MKGGEFTAKFAYVFLLRGFLLNFRQAAELADGWTAPGLGRGHETLG
jgi:hypothetical protein